MVLKVFAVRDSKAKAFLQPFFSGTVESAIRAFGDAVREDKSPICKHPEDYVLYELGSFDDGTGYLDKLEAIHMLGIGSDFVINKVDMLAREEVFNGKT